MSTGGIGDNTPNSSTPNKTILLDKVVQLINEKHSLSPSLLNEKVVHAHHLQQLKNLRLALEQAEEVPALIGVLKENWVSVKGTVCSYTAQPESDVTLLLCDIAQYLAEKTNTPAINFLMPGLNTESFFDGYDNLDTLDLKTVLRTHILSASGNYLLPIRLLSDLECDKDIGSQKIPNVYYDYNQAGEGYVTLPECHRLLNHSPETQALRGAHERFRDLLADKSLLGQLHVLIKALRMNCVAGIGSEEHAGSLAYPGIIGFYDYYGTLTENQKSAIPEAVKGKIELLRSLSENPAANSNATVNMETCLNTRQVALASAVKEHEATLSKIGTDNENKAALLKAARESFVLCQKQLTTRLAEHAYHGHDPLNITAALIKALPVTPTVSSEADLQDLITLSAVEITELVEGNEALFDQLIEMLSEFEKLVV